MHKFKLPVKTNVDTTFFLVVLGLWLVIFMHIPLFNVGGFGFILPQNILTWIVVILLSGGMCLLGKYKALVVTPFMFCYLLGGLLLTLPILWTRTPQLLTEAVPRFLGLWGGLLFYVCLVQLRLSARDRRLVLWFIAISAVVEGGFVLRGLYFPEMMDPQGQRFAEVYGRYSLGSFQQINVTASWLATGLAVLMLLAFTEGCVVQDACRESWSFRRTRMFFACLFMMILSCCLILTTSRVGWLGGMVCFLVMVVCIVHAKVKKHLSLFLSTVLVMAPVVGAFVGVSLLHGPVEDVMAHSASNYQRLLTLKVTWQMVMLHPLTGWGQGAFLTAFQNYMAQSFAPNPSLELMEHPHNELLYVWFEGGAMALAGLLLILFAIVRLLFRQFDIRRLMLWSALIPILLHTQVEFPLYYSAAHFVVLLTLLAMLDVPCPTRRMQSLSSTSVMNAFPLFRCAVALLVAGILIWLVRVMHVGFVLSHFESRSLGQSVELADINPPMLTNVRFGHDLNLQRLLSFYSNQEKHQLVLFLRENAIWLKDHPEPDGYDNQINVLMFLDEPAQATSWRKCARQLFPWDKRFNHADRNK
ncbi:PglL family O-oligosaccharyltransferase [Serratia liquefaciens]|uniref:PglL family O-oligosaccharyltransferase n=1 Tax=Serratia liquefaciens TaxID=614 RepID=UPI003827B21F